MKGTEWSIYTIRHMTDEALCVGKLQALQLDYPGFEEPGSFIY